MKSLPLAAAALLLGTSAFAMPPSTPPAAAPAVAKPAYFAAVQSAAELQTASAVNREPAAVAAGNPDLDLAVDPDVEQASLTGMGGPEEPLDLAPTPEALAAAGIAPRPAAQNYPPCRPGPGDDNCIQLYEPGVRVALAGWTQPTGGLAGGEATAMGGPYEPVDGAGAETAMAGDGILDTGMGEIPADEALAI